MGLVTRWGPSPISALPPGHNVARLWLNIFGENQLSRGLNEVANKQLTIWCSSRAFRRSTPSHRLVPQRRDRKSLLPAPHEPPTRDGVLNNLLFCLVFFQRVRILQIVPSLYYDPHAAISIAWAWLPSYVVVF